MGNTTGILDKRLALGLNDFTADFDRTRVRVLISPSHKAPGATTHVLRRNSKHPLDAVGLAGAFLAYEHYAPHADDHRRQTIADFLAIHLTEEGHGKRIQQNAAFFQRVGLTPARFAELEKRRVRYFKKRQDLIEERNAKTRVFEL